MFVWVYIYFTKNKEKNFSEHVQESKNTVQSKTAVLLL